MSGFPRDDLDHATDLVELAPMSPLPPPFPALTFPAATGEPRSSPTPFLTTTGDGGTFGDCRDCGEPRLPRLSLPCWWWWWWWPPAPTLLSSSSLSSPPPSPPLARFPKEVDLAPDGGLGRGEVLVEEPIARAPTAPLSRKRWSVDPMICTCGEHRDGCGIRYLRVPGKWHVLLVIIRYPAKAPLCIFAVRSTFACL